MYVNIFSYLWDIKVFLKKNLFFVNFFGNEEWSVLDI